MQRRAETRTEGRLRASAVIIIVLLTVAYAVLGFVVLEPDSVYSGDIGVKFVQARALAASRFTSLDIPYPGQFLDPARELFPIRPPFVMTAGSSTQAIFPPASATLQALAVAALGMRGMVLVSLLAAAVILIASARLAERGQNGAVLLTLGIAGPLWFYAISGWEHAPAVAFSTAAFALAVRSSSGAAPFLAGVSLGAGATLRDEVLLLAPGLLLAIWMRERRVRPLAAAAAGIVLPLICAAAIEVWWFQRPVAAHLRHAVHLLQSALHVSDAPNPDVPVLKPLSFRERYETVVQYWLLGYGRDPWIVTFGIGLLAAFAVRFWQRSSIGLLIWLLGVVVLASIDLHELVTAPKWLAGLHRVSPYLVLALFPLPSGAERRSSYVPVVLATTGVYLALAFAGADTTGGKSLGPRLLLPLMPLLTVAAVSTLGHYLFAAGQIERWIGRTGVLLVVMSAAMHVLGTVPAYVERNRGDSEAIESVARASDRIVVADDAFTAQLLFPLYYRKIVFLADTPELGQRLGAMLSEQRLAGAILISRLERPIVELTPFRLERSEQRGRMVVQYWGR
jgi:hypothetical protein